MLGFPYHVAVNALRSKRGRFVSEDTAVGYFHGGQNDVPDLHRILYKRSVLFLYYFFFSFIC